MHSNLQITTLISILWAGLAMGSGVSLAQDVPSSGESDWQIEMEQRLRAIYERGEFHAKRFEAEWLPDSETFWLQEADPQTGRNVPTSYEVVSGKKIPMKSRPAPQPGPRQSPDGRYRIENRNRELVVRELETGNEVELTPPRKGREIGYRRPQWSPDGKKILFIQSDETDVRLRPMLEPVDPSYPRVRNQRFARVGETIATLRVGIVSADGGGIDWLDLHAPDEGIYLGQVEWAGNSEEVLVERLSRFRDQREFLLFNLNTGEPKTIFSETNKAWAVGSQGKNSGLTWLSDGKEFLLLSEKDGWRHAYRYSREGVELTLLTPGDYDVIENGFVDEENGFYYFYASPENGTQRYLYRVSLDGSETLKRITPDDQPGTHRYVVAPNRKWAFHAYSSFDTPPVYDLVELENHRTIRLLESNQSLQNRMQKLIQHPTEFFQIDIGVEHPLDAWMIKPRDFDEAKKYPLFVYIYGEPHAQTVLDEWGIHHVDFHRAIADLGYLVVSIDNRGTPAPKGAQWRRSIFGSMGPLSTEDQAKALKELARIRPYVDLTRVGIWGWSGGGSNTLNALFRKPELYNVGIAVVPKPQPHLYNAWFQEIYMRTREVNQEGYNQSAPLNFAEGLNGDLLIITGSGETNTHIQIVEGLVDRLIELGKPFDYMVYPNRNHGLREGRGTAVHLRMLKARYLMEHLPSGPR